MFKRTFPAIIILALVLVFAACGSSGSSTGSGGTTPTTAPTTAPTATPTTASSSALIMTATATVNGKSETILTNAQGRTLYYFTSDTSTKAACGSGCTSIWPPLLFTGSGSPTASGTLPGTLTAASDGNGNQVEYNGHPLYTYSGDNAAGQTNGEGLFGKWFVATPNLAAAGGSQATPTPTTGGY